ncbi:papilin-like [Physella acuta]|uniref:papilin-like n=1 Tax=Physella acuta TaxID=109671 RepID=UPI0027DAF329|nr:papilin-like [Physella acuta]
MACVPSEQVARDPALPAVHPPWGRFTRDLTFFQTSASCPTSRACVPASTSSGGTTTRTSGSAQRFWDGGCQTNGNSFEDDVTCITRCMPELKENGCKTSTFGCCADGVTYAKGNNKQGCPPFTGLCSESRYGCCHDGVTAAKGENNKGCREEHRLVGGCAGTRYGCCADGVTSARGENRYGCPSTCVASAYGCCSDGVTSASGPNKQGCPEEEKNIVLGGCESTRYGCCNDGVTAARDEQKLNCPGFDPAYCALPKDAGSCGNFTLKWFFDTKYGSCRQFYYGGCKGNQNRFPTREDCEYHCVNVEGPGACRLPSVVGPCKSYQTKYFFNLEKKKCEQFTYGGCIGNTNKFNTLEDCEASCSQRGRPSACAKLPCKNGFSCQDSADGSYTCSCHSDWGRNCDHIPDYWCLSNAECGQGLKCVHQRKCQDGLCENLARCTAAARVFKCDSSVCSANEDCVNDDSISRGYFCQPKTSYRRSSSVHLGCRLSEFGCCPDSQSPASGPNQQGCPVRCENSRYGCCADGRTPAKGYDYEGCDVEGSGDMPCERKRYGCCDDGVTAATGPRGRGCGETTDSEDRVQQTTQPSVKQTGETVFVKCQAPLVIKLCTKYEVKWRYNYTNQVCERFWWGGCQDNGNVFNDNKTCHSECKKATENTDTDFMNICDMPSYTGPCRAYINRYYYNPRERSCLQFVYGGCQGNENNFETIERCQQECMGTVVSGTDNVRTTPRPTPVTVPIQANRETLSLSGESTVREDGDIRLTCTSQGLPNVRLRWYFNGEDVQQNSNARVRQQTSGYSHDLELRIPYAKPSSSGVYVCRSSTGKQERIDVTVVPAAPRTPPPTSDTSEERSLIMYGEFNFNVGATIDISCRATGPERPTDMDWYFNGRPLNAYSYVSINTYPDPSSRNALLSNVTIRNAGKRNEGTYVCRSRPYADRRLKMIRINEVIGPVATSPPVQESTTPTGDSTAICLMEAVTGVCRANINRWYYNHKEGTCSPFVYGGCGGNGNNFKTADECNNFCSAQEICMKQKDVGNCRAAMPRFYFDSKAGQCYSFLYGGCGGNLNNFESLSACDRRCHQYKRSTATQVIVVQSTGEGARAEEDACQMLPAKGTCKANSIKWFYSPARNRCESFQYSGCGGNNNRFDSQESCMQKCYKEPASNRRPTTPESNVIPSVESNVCVLKKDQGGCNNWTILWYYDTNKAACMRFYYGGCTGNGNRFNNKEECENKCIRGAVAPSTPRPDSCRYSAYGCCNDGITRAVDRERSNCYESNTSLEENQRLVSVKVGTQASLHCPYTGSEVFWFKDINRLYSSPLYDILPNGTLIFNQVTEDVAGIYSCRVKDVYAVGRIQRFKVDIHVPVHIMPGPIRMAFKPGVRAVLTCHATGTPPPRVSWEYRGRVLSSGRHHQIFGNGTLVVDSIQPEDAGDYTCSAENGVNSPSRRKIQVQIRDPVEVTIQKHKHTYSEGDTITLVCKGAGYPAPTLEWKKDGKVLTSDNNTRVSNGDLTILSASIEDSGTYKCIANGSTEKAVEDVTTIQIQLQSPSTKCVDTRKVQDCRRYVLRHMCGIHIFANMCCKSCRDAGKL